MEICGALPGIYLDGGLRCTCSALGRGQKLVVYWPCHPACHGPKFASAVNNETIVGRTGAGDAESYESLDDLLQPRSFDGHAIRKAGDYTGRFVRRFFFSKFLHSINYIYSSIIRTGAEWYKLSKLNHPFDIHLCGYSSLLRIVAGFHDEIFSDRDSPSGLNESADFRSITLRHNEKLGAFHEEWARRFKEDSDPESEQLIIKSFLVLIVLAPTRSWREVPMLAPSVVSVISIV